MELIEVLRTIRARDPARPTWAEALFCYAGLHALLVHRLANRLWRWGLRAPARIVSHIGRFFTGIEIHPGATIGRRLFIDHGMGVVIGETAEIGDWVVLYQGVTLGGTGKQKGKRHPTLRNDVVVGVGAIVLGDITVGEGARIGGGAVGVKDVPPHATAVGVPARIVATRDPRTGVTRRVEVLPDPEGEMLRGLHDKVLELEARLSDLEEATHTHHAEHRLTYDALPESLWRILYDGPHNGRDEEYNLGAGI
ncbi:MAG: serine O-acetyltransferase [Acetobacteraceae bacterium]|nr:serine O-acetyltransferase [Acetobacteraceae bacterium]